MGLSGLGGIAERRRHRSDRCSSPFSQNRHTPAFCLVARLPATTSPVAGEARLRASRPRRALHLLRPLISRERLACGSAAVQASDPGSAIGSRATPGCAARFPAPVIGEILVDLGDDLRPDVRMKRPAQVGEGARRRRDHERRRGALAHQALESAGNHFGEPVLFDTMPVGRLDGAPDGRRGERELAAGAVGPCSRVGEIGLDEKPFGDEISELLVACIAHKQRHHSPNAKGNFCFDRVTPLDRSHVVLDLRLKR